MDIGRKNPLSDIQHDFTIKSFSKIRPEGNFPFLKLAENKLKYEILEAFLSGISCKYILSPLLFAASLKCKARVMDIKRQKFVY